MVQLVEFAYFEKQNAVESLRLHLPPLSHGLQHMETIDKKPSAEYYESTKPPGTSPTFLLPTNQPSQSTAVLPTSAYFVMLHIHDFFEDRQLFYIGHYHVTNIQIYVITRLHIKYELL